MSFISAKPNIRPLPTQEGSIGQALQQDPIKRVLMIYTPCKPIAREISIFHYFRRKENEGSLQAQTLLNDHLECTIHNKAKFHPEKKNIAQSHVLQNMRNLLIKLSETNSAYNRQTVENLYIYLCSGHCFGFSTYYGQLALEQENGEDLTPKLANLMYKSDSVLTEGFFEAPQGFNYLEYKAGNKQGLTAEQESQMLITDEIKQFIQIIRFAQQRIREAEQWFDEQTLNQMNKGNIPLTNQQNLAGILGESYVVGEITSVSNQNFQSLSEIALSLTYNLKESNVTLLTFPTSIEDHVLHTVTIIYRENKFYLMDSNSTSLESNFDFQYSALAFQSIKELISELINRYMTRSPVVKNTNNRTLIFFEKKNTKNTYIKTHTLRSHDQLIKLNKLYDLLGEDLFNATFPIDGTSYKIPSHLMKILHEKGALSLISLPNITEIDISLLQISEKDYEDVISIIQNCPRAILVIDQADLDHIGAIYYKLATQYHNGDKANFIDPDLQKATDYYQQASELGNCDAKYQLSQLYKAKKQHRLYLTLLDEIISLKEDARALYERGIAYQRGSFQSIKDTNLAIVLLKRAAQLNHSDAQFEVANYEFYINRDKKRWFEQMTTSAQMNNKKAYFMFGMAHMHGENGLEKDLDKARDFFEKSKPIAGSLSAYTKVNIEILLNQKNAMKLMMEGNLYRFTPDGKNKKPHIALRYYKAAASLGSNICYLSIVYMYKNKEITTQNPNDYLKVIESLNNNNEKYYLLADAYLTGDILPKDINKARHWFTFLTKDYPRYDALKTQIEEAEKLSESST